MLNAVLDRWTDIASIITQLVFHACNLALLTLMRVSGWLPLMPQVMYTLWMRRIQLYLEEEIDAALSVEAARQNTSRSALVREAVRALLGAQLETLGDPVDELVGSLDIEPDADIDAVIYGLER